MNSTRLMPVASVARAVISAMGLSSWMEVMTGIVERL